MPQSMPHAWLCAQAESKRAAELDPEEQRALLRALKLRWADVNAVYMRQPFASDTAGMRRRKEALEAQLGSLERDIRLLSAVKVIVLQEV